MSPIAIWIIAYAKAITIVKPKITVKACKPRKVKISIVFMVYVLIGYEVNVLILPVGKNPRGDYSPPIFSNKSDGVRFAWLSTIPRHSGPNPVLIDSG